MATTITMAMKRATMMSETRAATTMIEVTLTMLATTMIAVTKMIVRMACCNKIVF
jgi:hypothetical protein